MSEITIIGFGCCGQMLYRLFKDHFKITIYTRNPRRYQNVYLNETTTTTQDLSQAYQSKVIFYAIPISALENVIKQHQQYFNDHLLIDALSVKSYPAQIFEKYLGSAKARALLTHPLFSAHSSKGGFDNLSIVMDQFTATDAEYVYWKKFFTNCKLNVVEISAEEHDRLAANSQGVTHIIGQILEKFEFPKTSIDIPEAQKLHEIKEVTCNGSLKFFLDLQTYNPQTKNMRLRLHEAFEQVYHQTLPERIDANSIIYGIQGGQGSFNQSALNYYTAEQGITNFKIRYLYTTDKVLTALVQGDIDYGLFAIHNSVGGVVAESIHGMARHKFQIVDEFAIPIQHNLMKLPQAQQKDIDTIMAHPQIFKQCRIHLKNHYPHLTLISGDGDLIDSAKAAQALAEGALPANLAVLGPAILAQHYQLEVIDHNLQDDPTNNTSFLIVSR